MTRHLALWPAGIDPRGLLRGLLCRHGAHRTLQQMPSASIHRRRFAPYVFHRAKTDSLSRTALRARAHVARRGSDGGARCLVARFHFVPSKLGTRSVNTLPTPPFPATTRQRPQSFTRVYSTFGPRPTKQPQDFMAGPWNFTGLVSSSTTRRCPAARSRQRRPTRRAWTRSRLQ